ncbi:MAG: NAD(P)-binding domain-containing protein [Ectothiorhodospiraceae bacterium]|nr:NAD(P)-binding domain-containing protein [Ectothiorhodospiraceae bacterium]
MRFIIYGAGAVGGTIGARLFQHGFDVLLIARGPHYQAIAERGLTFQSPVEEVCLPIKVVSHPKEIAFNASDVVLMTVKGQHMADALDQLRLAAGDAIPVICCQNGVANERMALRRFSSVYSMVMILPASHIDPGIVQTQAQSITGILDAGVYPKGIDDTITEVCAILERSQFSAKPNANIMPWKYAKLLMNLNNAVQAVADVDEHSRDIARYLRNEALACYKKANLNCVDAKEMRERSGSIIDIVPVKGQTRGGGSSWQSIARKEGTIETDFLNGEIVQLGRLHGVPTPANEIVQRLGNQAAAEQKETGWITQKEIKSKIEALMAEALMG